MSDNRSPFVVTADWVEKNLGAPEFRIVDAAWYLPTQGRNGAEEYASGHIPGAVFFDQDAIADHSTGLPHSAPSPDLFADAVGKMGIADSDTIVVYDGPGFFSAPRVWWLFRLMGVEKVFVLDGGLDGWKKDGHRLETDLPEPKPAAFHVRYQDKMITSLQAMRGIVDGATRQIADARGPGRFSAEEPEPRAGMRGGHMPGAKNLPYGVFSDNGRFKSLEALKAEFDKAGIDLESPVTTTCGSGVTAAVITLALTSLGHSDATLYDGSWSEWGSLADTPVATGRD